MIWIFAFTFALATACEKLVTVGHLHGEYKGVTDVHTSDALHRTGTSVSIVLRSDMWALNYLHPALPASEASAAGTSMLDVIRTMSLSST
jgi:hypothetical protein